MVENWRTLDDAEFCKLLRGSLEHSDDVTLMNAVARIERLSDRLDELESGNFLEIQDGPNT